MVPSLKHMLGTDEWEIPHNFVGRALRQTQYVVSPENVSEEENFERERDTAL